jgi:hypothetical protein
MLALPLWGQDGNWGLLSSYERNPNFQDFPMFQLQFSSGLDMPFGEFAEYRNRRGGFAGRGVSHNIAINFYPFHIEANQGRGVHCLGGGFGYTATYNQFNQQALDNLLAAEYQNPIALTTQFENVHSRWRRNQGSISLSYLYVLEQRFMIGLDISATGIFARTPEYAIDRGNYIPFGYAHFFPSQRLWGSAGMGATGTFSLRYLLASSIGLAATVEGLAGRISYESEIYDTLLTGGSTLSVNRRIEDTRLPLRNATFRIGIVFNVGQNWDSRGGSWDDD